MALVFAHGPTCASITAATPTRHACTRSIHLQCENFHGIIINDRWMHRGGEAHLPIQICSTICATHVVFVGGASMHARRTRSTLASFGHFLLIEAESKANKVSVCSHCGFGLIECQFIAKISKANPISMETLFSSIEVDCRSPPLANELRRMGIVIMISASQTCINGYIVRRNFKSIIIICSLCYSSGPSRDTYTQQFEVLLWNL